MEVKGGEGNSYKKYYIFMILLAANILTGSDDPHDGWISGKTGFHLTQNVHSSYAIIIALFVQSGQNGPIREIVDHGIIRQRHTLHNHSRVDGWITMRVLHNFVLR